MQEMPILKGLPSSREIWFTVPFGEAITIDVSGMPWGSPVRGRGD
jgi:hypothetical protein